MWLAGAAKDKNSRLWECHIHFPASTEALRPSLLLEQNQTLASLHCDTHTFVLSPELQPIQSHDQALAHRNYATLQGPCQRVPSQTPALPTASTTKSQGPCFIRASGHLATSVLATPRHPLGRAASGAHTVYTPHAHIGTGRNPPQAWLPTFASIWNAFPSAFHSWNCSLSFNVQLKSYLLPDAFPDSIRLSSILDFLTKDQNHSSTNHQLLIVSHMLTLSSQLD